MIEIKNISKDFGSQRVLNNLSTVFENGKTNLIIGQSGAGKTVLLKCIVGLLQPEKGEVLYDGRNILSFGKKERLMIRREMGMLFQNAALFDSMSVLENVMFPLEMFSDKSYSEKLARARFCLERVKCFFTKCLPSFPQGLISKLKYSEELSFITLKEGTHLPRYTLHYHILFPALHITREMVLLMFLSSNNFHSLL